MAPRRPIRPVRLLPALLALGLEEQQREQRVDAEVPPLLRVPDGGAGGGQREQPHRLAPREEAAGEAPDAEHEDELLADRGELEQQQRIAHAAERRARRPGS